MSDVALQLSPHLPAWAILALALLAAVLLVLAALQRQRGVLLRALFAALLVAALLNPVLHRDRRQALPDIAVVVADRSASQRLAGRERQTAEAVAELHRRLQALGGVEIRDVDVPADERTGTNLFEQLGEATAEIDRSRLGAVIAVTDGEVHDAPEDPGGLGLGVPIDTLLTGHEGEIDRRIVIDRAPGFGVVGEPQNLTVSVLDESAPQGSTIPLTLRQDGRAVASVQAVPGRPTTIPFRLDKAGPTMFEVEAAAHPGELTTVNNHATVEVNGVRDRLRVLLVSGQPYPGLRVWRNLLKADPAVDLVHFTILRPPEKQDGTPIRELALIAFPSRELFEVKLNEFDLIIFDRYSRRGLLPLVYLENIARYVENGGALLEAAGPEFAEPSSLYRTPLARVLPGRPSGEVFERGFSPTLTDLGRQHPVTAGLDQAEGGKPWGRWFRQVDVETEDSQVLMTGVADRPLLILKRAGKGRVAQLLSDQAWLWARGEEGGGPQSLLLRRLVHWLMKEPSLEEEGLDAQVGGDRIAVTRRSLRPRAVEATVTTPSGRQLPLQLLPGADGMAHGRLDATEDGLYRITDGTYTAYATPRPVAPAELADLRATPAGDAAGGRGQRRRGALAGRRHARPAACRARPGHRRTRLDRHRAPWRLPRAGHQRDPAPAAGPGAGPAPLRRRAGLVARGPGLSRVGGTTMKEPGPFASTVDWYVRCRPRYPHCLLEGLAQRLRLDASTRVIDLGCGPGFITIGVAAWAGEVIGVDPEPLMLAAARDAARKAGAQVRWIEGTAADLPPDLGPCRAAFMGRSFPWMDKEAVLERLDGLIDTQGAVVLLGERFADLPQNAWRAAERRATKGWSEGPNRRFGRGYSLARERDVLLASSFTRIEFLRARRHARTSVDDLVGRALSRSTTSPARLGDRIDAFRGRPAHRPRTLRDRRHGGRGAGLRGPARVQGLAHEASLSRRASPGSASRSRRR